MFILQTRTKNLSFISYCFFSFISCFYFYVVTDNHLTFIGCGGTIDASKTNTGFFTHAGYPGQYQNSEDCTYIIKTIPGKRLKLSFDKFSLEAHEKCQFDYLEVRDGSTVQAPSLGRFCGSAKPRDVLSKGNSLLIKFVSDYASKGSGFLVKWNVELDNTLPTLKPNTSEYICAFSPWPYFEMTIL